MSLSLDALVGLVDDDLATLSAADFALDPRTTGALSESWHHSDAPFEEAATAGGRQHLEYIVDPVSVSEASDAVNRRSSQVLMDLQLDVTFDYRVRPSTQVADYRKAMVAAARVVKRLRNTAQWAPGQGVMYVATEQRFEPRQTEQKLLINVRTSHILRYFEGF